MGFSESGFVKLQPNRAMEAHDALDIISAAQRSEAGPGMVAAQELADLRALRARSQGLRAGRSPDLHTVRRYTKMELNRKHD